MKLWLDDLILDGSTNRFFGKYSRPRAEINSHTHIYSVAGIKFLIPVGVQPRSNLEDVAREIGRWPRKQKNYIVRDASGPSVFAVSHYVHRRNDKTCPITYFICLTMVLLPDSPAPEMKKRWNPLAYNIVWQIQRFFFFTSSIRSSIPYRVSPQVPNWVQAHDGLKLSHSLGAGQEKESCSVDLFYFFKRWRRKRRVFPPLPLPPIFVFFPLSLSLTPVGSSYIQMVPRLLLLLPARLRPFLKLAIQMKKSCCLSWFPQSRLLLLLLPFALFLFLSALDFCSCPENNPLMTLLGRNSPSYVFFPICLCVQWRGGRVSCAWGANSFPGQASSEVNILIVWWRAHDNEWYTHVSLSFYWLKNKNKKKHPPAPNESFESRDSTLVNLLTRYIFWSLLRRLRQTDAKVKSSE